MEDRYRKKIILSLRWTAIIVTSYLILFGRVELRDLHLAYFFIIGYILSNVLLTFLPKAWFSNPKFFYSLAIIDTGLVSLGMYLSKMVTVMPFASLSSLP